MADTNLVYPYEFEGGTKAVASEVNANFEAVKVFANGINATLNDNEIYNKFPTLKERNAAKNFKAPDTNLPDVGFLQNDTRANLSSFGDNSISNISRVVKSNSVIQDTVKRVNVADIGYGAKKALSGMTFGASDWALRRLGLDNEQDYLAKKQDEGLGGLTKGLGVASEIGGNILGGGGALAKGLQNAGFEGLRLATTAGGAEGLAYGLTGSDRLADAPENMAWGAGLGAALPVAFHRAGQSVRAIAKPFSSRLMTAGMKGGLNNVASNPDAVKILKQGLRNNDDIAQSYLEHVLPATRNINRGTAEMVDNALTHRINVPETIAAERARYGDYMAAHGADEVMDFAPTREQLINYPAESKFNLPKKTLTSSKAENILRNKAQNSGVDIGGNIDHYLNKRGRAHLDSFLFICTSQTFLIVFFPNKPFGFMQRMRINKTNAGIFL